MDNAVVAKKKMTIMPTWFLLSPLKPSARQWKASTVVRPIQIQAEDESHARFLADRYFCIPIQNTSLPWKRTDLVAVRPLAAPLDSIEKIPLQYHGGGRGRRPVRPPSEIDNLFSEAFRAAIQRNASRQGGKTNRPRPPESGDSVSFPPPGTADGIKARSLS